MGCTNSTSAQSSSAPAAAVKTNNHRKESPKETKPKSKLAILAEKLSSSNANEVHESLTTLENLSLDPSAIESMLDKDLRLIQLLMEVAITESEQAKAAALGTLWNITSNKTAQDELLSEEYSFVSFLTGRIRKETGITQLNGIGILYNLSLDNQQHGSLFANEELIQLLIGVVKSGSEKAIAMSINTLQNFAYENSANQLLLVSPKFALLPTCKSLIDKMKSPFSEELIAKKLAYLFCKLSEEGSGQVAESIVNISGIHYSIIDHIISLQENNIGFKPTSTAALLLSTSMNLARHWSVRSALISARLDSMALLIFQQQSPGYNAVKAMIILLFLYGDREMDSNMMQYERFVVTDEHIQRLIDILNLTLQGEGSRDFDLGVFKLSLLSAACLVLAQSDSNKQGLVDAGCVPALLTALTMFQEKAGAIANGCGGGGEDIETASLCIKTLTHISFNFETIATLQCAFKCDERDTIGLLHALNANSKLDADSHRQVAALLQRFQLDDGSLKSKDVNEAEDGLEPVKHVMLSYCHHRSAHPQYVKQLAASLRSLGYDVWRDMDGSMILPPMEGSINDRMAAAIEMSDTIIVCVSAAYKLSENCRIEADYASTCAKRGEVQLLFVMMNEDYTTVSRPKHCDGWLGILVGSHLWHPMWQEDMISSTAKSLSVMLSPHSIASQGMRVLERRSSLNSSKVVLSSPPTLPQVQSSFSPALETIDLSSNSSNDPWVPAWDVIQNAPAVIDQEGLQALLQKQGCFEAVDLSYCEEDTIQELASFLKPAQKNKFLALMKKIKAAQEK